MTDNTEDAVSKAIAEAVVRIGDDATAVMRNETDERGRWITVHFKSAPQRTVDFLFRGVNVEILIDGTSASWPQEEGDTSQEITDRVQDLIQGLHSGRAIRRHWRNRLSRRIANEVIVHGERSTYRLTGGWGLGLGRSPEPVEVEL